MEMIKEKNKYQSQDSLTKEIVRLSVRYQVLSRETAFIGVIKQDDKVIGELTKVVIPTVEAEGSRGTNPWIPQKFA